jgi:hypothetical protein
MTTPTPHPNFLHALSAISLGLAPTLRAILKVHPNIAHQVDHKGHGLLFACAQAPEASAAACAQALLETGADPHKLSPDGETALVRAAAEGPLNLALLLLRAGSDPNERGLGPSAAMWAAKRSDGLPILKALADAGADFTVYHAGTAADWARCQWRETNENFCRELESIQLATIAIGQAAHPAQSRRPGPRL